MKIRGLTVCVNYAEFLALGIERWKQLDTLVVVTAPQDSETQALCAKHDVLCVTTDLFYRDGATFNKGRAMEWARKKFMKWEDHILFFDADIVPQQHWRQAVERSIPKMDYCLYSAWRYQAGSAEMIGDVTCPKITGDVIGVGYFQLFHSADPKVNGPLPLLETHWIHAGNYDNQFMHKWPRTMRKELPIRLFHVGPRDNWWGRDNKHDFEKMQTERTRRGGRWDHEVISSTMPID